MLGSHQPPQRLNEPPPVKHNCTKAEIQIIKRTFIGVALVTTFLLTLLLTILGGKFVLALVFSFLVCGVGSGWVGFNAMKNLGKKKDLKSAKYVYQQVEKFKRQLGLGNQKVIYRNGKWSNYR